MKRFIKATSKYYDYACMAKTRRVLESLGPSKPRAELRKCRKDLLTMQMYLYAAQPMPFFGYAIRKVHFYCRSSIMKLLSNTQQNVQHMFFIY